MNYFSRYRSAKTFSVLSDEAKDWYRIFLEKALRGGRHLSRADRRFFRSLAGRADPLAVLTGADGRARYRLMRGIFRLIRDMFRADPSLQFLSITIIHADWETSDEQTHISLTAIQGLARRLMRRITPDWLGIVELQTFSNRRHPAGGKVTSLHVHILAFGHDIEGVAHLVALDANARLPATLGCDAVVVEPVRPTLLDLGRVIRYLLKSPNRNKNVYVNAAKGIRTINESESGDRYIRYFRMFQFQSLLQLDRLIFGSGRGGRIRAEALREVHDWREVSTGRRKRADVMADIQAFWGELMPRLGQDRFQPPVVD